MAGPEPVVADDPALCTPDLQRFYRPRSIAIVGAHDTRPGLASVTERALARARRVGASAYLVNPTKDTVYGRPSLPALGDVPEPIDVALVLVRDAASVINGAAAAGARIRFYLVFSNGYGELGTAEGHLREAELVAAARQAGARIVGPNTNANAWDPVADLPGPRIGVVSQSGVQGRPFTQAQELGVALSYWAPTGNEADLEAADFIEFLASDESTAAICAYIEGFRSGPRARAAMASAIRRATPVVLIKVGRSGLGEAVAQTHTGHLTGSDEVWDAFFEQFGVTRVDDFDELVEVGAALARCPVPPADGVVICSASGGAAAHVADLAAVGGLELPPLLPETVAALGDVIPAGLRRVNPVDNGGTAVMAGAGLAIWQLCLRDPHIGLMLCPVPAPGAGLTEPVTEAIVAAAATAAKPILPIWSGPVTDHPCYRALWSAGLPVFSNVRNAVTAARALLRHPARSPGLLELAEQSAEPVMVAGPPAGVQALDEAASVRWLSARGLRFAPHRVVDLSSGPAAVADAAAELGFPVVLKGRGVIHKTERGFVRTGLADRAAVAEAAADLAALGAAGWLVAEQVDGGVELLAGIGSDAVLGPVILVGAGGTAAEVHRDVARSVLPLTRQRAEHMVASLRIAPLLDGWRGAPPADRDAVVETLLTLARIAAEGEVREVDINPLLARPEGAVGLDALVVLPETSDEGAP